MKKKEKHINLKESGIKINNKRYLISNHIRYNNFSDAAVVTIHY
jgi:hypothetical protein